MNHQVHMDFCMHAFIAHIAHATGLHDENQQRNSRDSQHDPSWPGRFAKHLDEFLKMNFHAGMSTRRLPIRFPNKVSCFLYHIHEPSPIYNLSNESNQFLNK